MPGVGASDLAREAVSRQDAVMQQSHPQRAEMATHPFIIDVFGWFPPERLTVRFDPSPRPTTPELESLIETEWDRQTESARQSDRMLLGRITELVLQNARPQLRVVACGNIQILAQAVSNALQRTPTLLRYGGVQRGLADRAESPL